MKRADVAIIGGGLAGSAMAVMLGRAGIGTALIDPRATPPDDFRCEKLDSTQRDMLARTGLEDVLDAASTPVTDIWVSRFGHLVDVKPETQSCFTYQSAVAALRGAIPPNVRFFETKVTEIANSDERQHVTLANGERLTVRLAVLANGLNTGLRHALGIGKRMISPGHSISIGFDMVPLGRRHFDFPALTVYPERLSNRMAYLTLFPIGETMRANLFVYRDLGDPWLIAMRREPEAALFDLLPSLERITGPIQVEGTVRIRPVDLYEVFGHVKPGIVLAGDAYATSCPAAGTGASKVFTDVERLCSQYIPHWLATPGMPAAKVAGFYRDAIKCETDQFSLDKAIALKATSLDGSVPARARRVARFVGHMGVGAARRIRGRAGAPPADVAVALRSGEPGAA